MVGQSLHLVEHGSMENITLYNYFRSSTSYRARIALHLKKLTFEYKPIHLLNNGGEQNSEAYRKINPMGGVPTLVHNGHSIAQSSAIIEYLDEAFPQSYQLLPKDIVTRAHIREFCQIINADTHAYGNLKTLGYLTKNFSMKDDQKSAWLNYWMHEGLTACEKILEKSSRKFCFGDSPSAADVFLIPAITTAQRFEVDTKIYPNMTRVFDHCLKEEAFLKAHPFRQIDTPAELKI
jgi:maleylacetoacetate isomerase/maleylpyruvate isomerase